MKTAVRFLACAFGAAAFGFAADTPRPDYAVKAVPLTSVNFTGGFWGARQKTDLAVTIRHTMKECEDTGRIRNFELAAAALKGAKGGKFATAYAFDDSDVYKVIEAAAYSLALRPDPALDKDLDAWIAKIAAAMEPDGYIYTARTINPEKPLRMSGPKRWVNEQESHELYCAGHMYEAAVAHFQATGRSRTRISSTRPSARLRTSSRWSPAMRSSRWASSSSTASPESPVTWPWRSSSSTSGATPQAISSTAPTTRTICPSSSRPRPWATRCGRRISIPASPTSRP
jgi:hypothetical protein